MVNKKISEPMELYRKKKKKRKKSTKFVMNE